MKVNLELLSKKPFWEEYVAEADSSDVDYLLERACEQEIIGCYRATEFLLKFDPSLRISLELAAGIGLSIQDLVASGSETLATLLLRDELGKEIYECCED